MLAERYLKRRYEAGEEAECTRNKERIRIHNARLDAWDERRLRAQAEGKPFDEPMPILGDEGVALRDVLTEEERRPDGSVGVWIRVGRMICRSFRR